MVWRKRDGTFVDGVAARKVANLGPSESAVRGPEDVLSGRMFVQTKRANRNLPAGSSMLVALHGGEGGGKQEEDDVERGAETPFAAASVSVAATATAAAAATQEGGHTALPVGAERPPWPHAVEWVGNEPYYVLSAPKKMTVRQICEANDVPFLESACYHQLREVRRGG